MNVLDKGPRVWAYSYGLDVRPPFISNVHDFTPFLVMNRFRPSEKNTSFFLLPLAWHAARRAYASASSSCFAPLFHSLHGLFQFPCFISFNFPPSTRISFYVTRRKTLRSIDASCYREGRNFLVVFGSPCNICMMFSLHLSLSLSIFFQTAYIIPI